MGALESVLAKVAGTPRFHHALAKSRVLRDARANRVVVRPQEPAPQLAIPYSYRVR